MPGQAQDSVALHVPARNDYMAAVGGDFGRDGLVAEFGHEPLEGLHVLRDDLHFRIGGVDGMSVMLPSGV